MHLYKIYGRQPVRWQYEESHQFCDSKNEREIDRCWRQPTSTGFHSIVRLGGASRHLIYGFSFVRGIFVRPIVDGHGDCENEALKL
jgi:hypothetical protein